MRVCVAADAFGERLGDELTIPRFLQQLGVLLVRQTGDLGEDRRHVIADEYDEGRGLDSAVPEPGIGLQQRGVEGRLDGGGEGPGLVLLGVDVDAFEQRLEVRIMNTDNSPAIAQMIQKKKKPIA